MNDHGGKWIYTLLLSVIFFHIFQLFVHEDLRLFRTVFFFSDNSFTKVNGNIPSDELHHLTLYNV